MTTPTWTPVHGQEYRSVPYRPERMPEEESLAVSTSLRQRMNERRTVRQFSTEPVPEQIIRNAIAVASTAPSGAHQQPWTFVLVKDPGVRRRIREAAEHEERISYAGRLGEEWLDVVGIFVVNRLRAHRSPLRGLT